MRRLRVGFIVLTVACSVLLSLGSARSDVMRDRCPEDATWDWTGNRVCRPYDGWTPYRTLVGTWVTV